VRVVSNGIRRLPRHVIVAKLKARRVRQQDVAAAAGVSTAYVSQTIARRVPPGDKCEAVWSELARILGGEYA